MTARSGARVAVDPARYHESIEVAIGPIATSDPVCLYLETTNRCNLLCTTCPRTYADLEPQADMSWERFTRIVDQVPNIARLVLRGVGELMLVKELPHMVRHLEARGAYVLFNTNGGRELCDSGLDELRVSNCRALPCCIAPFSQRGYENYTLGDATQETLREIWNGPAYQSFRAVLHSDAPPRSCASCGQRWSL